jgi:hypothetical protein
MTQRRDGTGGLNAETADHQTNPHHRDQVVGAMSSRDVGELVLIPHSFEFGGENIRVFFRVEQ